MLKVRGNINNFGEIFATVKIDEYGSPLYEDKFTMLFGHRKMKNVKKGGVLYMQNIETGEVIDGDWADLANDLNEEAEGKGLESYLFGEKRRCISVVSRNIPDELNSQFVELAKSGVIFCPMASKRVEATNRLGGQGSNMSGKLYLLLKGYSIEKERVFTSGYFSREQEDIEKTLSNRNVHLNNAYLSQLVDLEVKYTPVYGFTITKEGLIKVGKVFTL
mgnify:CR=1 FL=1|jgi:hypothetical protein